MLSELALKRIVGFCILMENNQGIVGKAPDYIDEKMTSMHNCQSEYSIRGLLDLANQAKYDQWVERWGKYL